MTSQCRSESQLEAEWVEMELYTYFRSSSAYRVRIALELKGLTVTPHFVHLTREGGQQHSDEFSKLNPERLVPVLRDAGIALTQSLAILEYLEEKYPSVPLLPVKPEERAWVRSLALQIACDISPLTNLRVLQYLENNLGIEPSQKQEWVQQWISRGLEALETHLKRDARTGQCCFGDRPTIADCCLVPQLFNARRFDVPMSGFPTLSRIDRNLASLPAFRSAAPEAQLDAPS